MKISKRGRRSWRGPGGEDEEINERKKDGTSWNIVWGRRREEGLFWKVSSRWEVEQCDREEEEKERGDEGGCEIFPNSKTLPKYREVWCSRPAPLTKILQLSSHQSQLSLTLYSWLQRQNNINSRSIVSLILQLSSESSADEEAQSSWSCMCSKFLCFWVCFGLLVTFSRESFVWNEAFKKAHSC